MRNSSHQGLVRCASFVTAQGSFENEFGAPCEKNGTRVLRMTGRYRRPGKHFSHEVALDPEMPSSPLYERRVAPLARVQLMTTSWEFADGPGAKQFAQDLARRQLSTTTQRNRCPLREIVTRLAFAGALTSVVLAFIGCGSQLTAVGEATSNETPPDAESPMDASQKAGVSTGSAEVDEALRGFLENDRDHALARLIVQQVPCGVLPWGALPPHPCATGEALGTVHELILTHCGLTWTTPEAARADLSPLLAKRPILLGSSRTRGDHKVLLSSANSLDRSIVLTISPLGITSYGVGCGTHVDPTGRAAVTLGAVAPR